MNNVNVSSQFFIVIVLSLTLFLFGTVASALEAEDSSIQTPSQQIGEGAREVIEAELSEMFENGDSGLASQAEDLIEAGVPPGILVSVVKSVGTDHLEAEELGGVFDRLREEVVDGDTPAGEVIKSIKSDHQLAERTEQATQASLTEEQRATENEGSPPETETSRKEGAEEKGPPDKAEQGKPEESGPPGRAGPTDAEGTSDQPSEPDEDESEEVEDEDDDSAAEPGPPADKGKPEDPGRNKGNGRSEEEEEKEKGRSNEAGQSDDRGSGKGTGRGEG